MSTFLDWIVYKAISYEQEDIDHLKKQRKYWAQREQNEKDKKSRKVCQRYIKAATFCVRHMEGDPTDWPLELAPEMRAMFCFTVSDPRMNFESIHGAVAQ